MKKTFRDGWFKTISDTPFDLQFPTKEMIKLNDICHALSQINRFNGHTKRPYSVAEHSCRCCDQAASHDEDVQLEVLIHDFSEAYYQDIINPLKMILGGPYIVLEARCQFLINERVLGHRMFDHEDVIKLIDYRMFVTECRDLTNQTRWWEERDEYTYTIPATTYGPGYWKDCLKTYLKNRGVE